MTLPENMVFHTLALSDGTFVTRVYGTEDNPKGTYEKNSLWMGIPIQNILAAYDILRTNMEWTGALFVVC